MKAALLFPILCMVEFAGTGALGQTAANSPQMNERPLTESGQSMVDGKPASYLIRHLPVSSFPGLPAKVVDVLNQKGCTIPQTYEAHRPENVVHGSFKAPGSSDWALLCSVRGTVSLLVFFGGEAGATSAQPIVLESAGETERLQAYPGSTTLGFDWGIDPATPEQVHSAQNGMRDPPAKLDHDALADSRIDRTTKYHFYANTAWTVLPMPD